MGCVNECGRCHRCERWIEADSPSDTDDYSRIRLPMKLIRVSQSWQLRPTSGSRTKKAPRSLPLPMPVGAALREHRERQQREQEAAGPDWRIFEYDGREVELVFTRRTGEPLHGQHVGERFAVRLRQAGLDHRRFHDLRHSAASVMLALKIPLKVVSEVLAHSGIRITADLYGHVDDEMLREQLAILDAAWGDGAEPAVPADKSAG
jgi:integrase